MKTALFDFHLPPELIDPTQAGEPPPANVPPRVDEALGPEAAKIVRALERAPFPRLEFALVGRDMVEPFLDQRSLRLLFLGRPTFTVDGHLFLWRERHYCSRFILSFAICHAWDMNYGHLFFHLINTISKIFSFAFKF